MGTSAWASPHGHVMEKSPFVKKQGAHALHCALMGHDIQKPCPHYQKRGLDGLEIQLPCHDNPAPASGSPSASSVFLHSVPFNTPAYERVVALPLFRSGFSFHLPSIPEPPPRFL
ncbi:hypothetical protein ACTRW9_04970 [Nitrospina sp. 32_T5]|uniref:hypothetical protein n=1 Tax=unclassified Nitrospina TaxID=2638683 RepID=UPI003F9947F7